MTTHMPSGAQDAPSRNGKYAILLVVLLSTNFGIVFLDRNALNYLMPFVSVDLKLNDAQIGMLAGATALSWAVSGFVFSAVSDRTGRRKSVLIAATVLFSLLSVASGFAKSFAALLAIRLTMGAAEGPVLPISQAIVAAEASPERRGLFMGIMNNFGSNLLGVMIAPPVLVGITAALGWRAGFWLAGIPGMIMALLILWLVKEPKAPRRGKSATAAAGHGASHDWAGLLRSRNILICAAISCCMLGWLLLGWAFLPVYFVRELHFAPETMGMLMSVLGGSAVVGSLLVPGLSDRIGRRMTMICFTLLGLVPPLAVGWSGLGAGPLAVVLFIGWLASGAIPIFMATIPSESTSRAQLATAMSLVMGIGEVVGGALMPVIAGALADRHGLIAVPVVQAGLTALAAILSLFLIETAPLHRSDPAMAEPGLAA